MLQLVDLPYTRIRFFKEVGGRKLKFEIFCRYSNQSETVNEVFLSITINRKLDQS